ncbi:YbbC [Salpingoeca rosetta]|uniref:YbbC n=1 Tax=Salpingoeca rosetta (strain ATCC 50818 / BSB-021) TaxID=946362 RepID=F2TYD0_SALR5|nr:YbbC [Salpingoeca rosetta]EGD78604.1 YbbC [Salpingoeca rosetta]|eukprot:XP_004997562.1 YbbC [Salpingoeca rosetta]
MRSVVLVVAAVLACCCCGGGVGGGVGVGVVGAKPGVITGAQRLATDASLRQATLQGRVGIISNPTGILNNLTHIVDFLHTAPDVNLVSIYGPEHGFRGDHQAGHGSGDVYTDNRTGLPVYSLYRKYGPDLAKVLEAEKLDTLVFDIQDVGCRFYTYIWTLWDVMSALPNTTIPHLVVLDRPNPIGANIVQGPVLEEAFSSFIGRYAIPLRHGMTVAELATLFVSAQRNASTSFSPPSTSPSSASTSSPSSPSSASASWGASLSTGTHAFKLTTVTMLNYERSMLYSDTHVPWVPPSPNMPTLNTALVYPGLGIIEGTNMSEGRGTTSPFNLFGAGFFNYTFIDSLHQATAATTITMTADLSHHSATTTTTKNTISNSTTSTTTSTNTKNSAKHSGSDGDGDLFAGAAVREAYFVPTFSKFAGDVVTGAELYVLDPSVFNPIAWGLAVVQVGLRASPASMQLFDADFDLHLGNNSTRLMLTRGDSIHAIVAAWQPPLQRFMHTRQHFLLY